MSLELERRPHLRPRMEDVARRVHDETANTLTHLAGFVLSVFGLAILLWLSIRTADPWRIVSASVYGVSLVALYGVSTLYHFTVDPKQKLRLQFWDHCAIYLLIAGSYTPFLLVCIRGGWGWSLLGVVWAAAIGGILTKFFTAHRASRISTLLYLLMGWLAIVAIVPLWDALRVGGFLLLVAGGLAYSAGTFFFALDHRRFFHAIWHLCVLGGSFLHFLAVILYVLPISP